MKLELKVNYDNIPYLVLVADNDELIDNNLEFFIREAREKGVEIVNESSLTSNNAYASIRLKGEVK